jgi:hypothetical protein
VDINGEAETFAPGEINAGAELRSKNPLISLFGRWGLSGKVGIGNAIPDGDNQWGCLVVVPAQLCFSVTKV